MSPTANPPSRPRTIAFVGLGLTGECESGECSITLTAFVFTSFVKLVSLIWRRTLS